MDKEKNLRDFQKSKRNNSSKKHHKSQCPSFLLNSPKQLKHQSKSNKTIFKMPNPIDEKPASKCKSTKEDVIETTLSDSFAASGSSTNQRKSSENALSDHQISFYSSCEEEEVKQYRILGENKIRKQSCGEEMGKSFEFNFSVNEQNQSDQHQDLRKQQTSRPKISAMKKSLFVRSGEKLDVKLHTLKFNSAKNLPSHRFKNKSNLLRQPPKIDDFELLKQLGKGATATVHLAKHKQTQSLYALKVVKKSYIKQQGVEESLVREIRNNHKIKDANIVQFYCVFDDKENIYFLMEYLRGSLYDKWIEYSKELPQKLVAKYIGDVCRGLRILHKNQIIHRDIKLENVLIQNDVAKIADLGCSIETLVLRKTCIGSPVYFSPEQLSNHFYNSKIDMWSVGIMTFELIFGYSPYENDVYEIFINKNQNHVLPSFKIPSFPQVSEQAQDFIQRLLEQKIGKRMSAEEALMHPFLAPYMEEIKLLIKTP